MSAAVHPELVTADMAVGLSPDGPEKLATFVHQTKRIGILMRCSSPPDGGPLEEQQTVDFLYSVFERSGLLKWYGVAPFDDAMRAIELPPLPLPYELPTNGRHSPHLEEIFGPDLAEIPDDRPEPPPLGLAPGETPGLDLPEGLPLSLAEWSARDLPAPRFLLGEVFSTTSRGLLVAPTGLGKTMFALSLAYVLADGSDFLHWRGSGRTARVLYIDGEMSRRLFKRRLADATTRHGNAPATLFAFSHEDLPGWAPLNTPAGQACVEALITRVGGVDFVVFDSVMCLTVGDMKEEESWAQTMPWIRALTRREIGQAWIHHTGHDETRGYGTKTREWQLDVVIRLEGAKRDDTDVSFALTFSKARERTPDNRHDFQDAKVALLGDIWSSEVTETAARPKQLSPMAAKFLEALQGAIASSGITANGRPAADNRAWLAEATTRGLIGSEAKDNARRAKISKYRCELIAANRVASENEMTWIIR